MTTWLDRARNSTHEHLENITLGVQINKYCYWKSQVRMTRNFLPVDLCKELNSLTSRFLLVISITTHDATKSRIIYLTETEGLIPSNSQFVIKKKGHKKRISYILIYIYIYISLQQQQQQHSNKKNKLKSYGLSKIKNKQTNHKQKQSKNKTKIFVGRTITNTYHGWC